MGATGYIHYEHIPSVEARIPARSMVSVKTCAWVQAQWARGKIHLAPSFTPARINPGYVEDEYGCYACGARG